MVWCIALCMLSRGGDDGATVMVSVSEMVPQYRDHCTAWYKIPAGDFDSDQGQALDSWSRGLANPPHSRPLFKIAVG